MVRLTPLYLPTGGIELIRRADVYIIHEVILKLELCVPPLISVLKAQTTLKVQLGLYSRTLAEDVIGPSSSFTYTRAANQETTP